MAALTVTTTPQQLLESWSEFQNRGPVSVFFESENTVSSSNGLELLPGGTYSRFDMSGWRNLWVVTASGTADLRIID